MEFNEHIVLIDKPAGLTSHTAVQHAKKQFGAKKAGHAGTLDPMATGLLIIGLDDGTKKLKEYVGLDKTYEAEILLGVRTDTGDTEGKVLEEKEVHPVSAANAKKSIEALKGTHRLKVPQYAATKIKGTPLYKLARAGKKVPRVLRDMEVISVEFKNIICENGRCTISCVLTVASGTYVRSLGEFVGKILGYPATLSALRRTRVWEFDIRDAVSII